MSFLLVLVIDLKAIRATIEAAFRFLSSPSTEIKLLQRSDQDVEDLEHYNTEDVQAEKDRKEMRKEGMISGLTTLFGAVLDKQKCWEQCSCKIGSMLKGHGAKDIIFM